MLCHLIYVIFPERTLYFVWVYNMHIYYFITKHIIERNLILYYTYMSSLIFSNFKLLNFLLFFFF